MRQFWVDISLIIDTASSRRNMTSESIIILAALLDIKYFDMLANIGVFGRVESMCHRLGVISLVTFRFLATFRKLPSPIETSMSTVL